jgi:NAD(P)-dependent dehydrogenase (short-subunit alcohol dehydrogenase family)
MNALASIVRFVRPVTDPIAPYSFNRMGYELNRRGFEPDDAPCDARGRIALVTGANSGIGRATSLELARRGCEVWMLCRDAGRGAEARDAIARQYGADRVHLGLVDMSSLESIRRLVAELPVGRVDVLVHNAGVLPSDKQLTADGVELTFATNVLGPYALTGLLMDRLLRSRDARVLFVASAGLYLQRLDPSLLDVDPSRFEGTRDYANAKRAQVVLAHVLAERAAAGTPITFASMHPGWADTTAVRTSLPKFHAVMRSVLRSAEQGADTVVWLATSERPRGTLGRFWFDRRVAPEYPLPWTREKATARQALVRRCEELSGVVLPESRGAAA